jgi:uncharacterized protein (DUF1786 family)
MKDLYDTTKNFLAVINFLIACLISVFDGRLRFIFGSSSALLISGVTSGGGLFSRIGHSTRDTVRRERTSTD